jgi:spermidine synthase
MITNLMMREKLAVLVTAFLEGMSVLVVEIAGARALAPFFGTTLQVWTAQITATLLFLALGYGLGGRLSRAGEGKLPIVLLAAGIWLVLFPFLRAPVLTAAAAALGVAGGSFAASAALFGVPLLCLGAVSPLLIARLEAVQAGAGGAAGRIFFTNTLGGLVGGWLTALVLIPHLPLRLALAGSGLLLLILGLAWGLRVRHFARVAAVTSGVGLLLFALAPRPAQSVLIANVPVTILETRQSGVGLIQVIDIKDTGRYLMIDGITQGGTTPETNTSTFEYIEYQNLLSHRYHPTARNALILGLGAGLLAKQLNLRGVRVTAVELEPRIEEAARTWFSLPSAVYVFHEDARAHLNRTTARYDLIFLDTFAGENTPWYLVTREAIALMKSRLNPGGRLLINAVTDRGGSPGLARIESALLTSFDEVKVFVEAPTPNSVKITAAIVAGQGLVAGTAPLPSVMPNRIRQRLADLITHERPARAEAVAGTDDFSDLDYAEAKLRSEWRASVLELFNASMLGD